MIEYEGMLCVIKARVKSWGVVETQHVAGAIYHGTRGLLPRGEALNDLRDEELVGGINIQVDSRKGVTKRAVFVSTRLPPRETSELAATLETIRKIGPCKAEIEVEGIGLTRKAKAMIRSGEFHRELLERIREAEAS